MLKKTVLYVSGIVNKQAVEHEKVNDFTTYFLQEELNDLKKNYNEEEQERYKATLQLFVEIDDHLFPVCRLNQIEALKEYTKDKIMKQLTEQFNSGINNNSRVSLGMAQYLNRMDDLEKVKQFRANKKHEEQLERERLEKEKELQKEREWNKELDAAITKLLEGSKIDGEYFVGLCDRYDIKIPLRTRGWALNSLSMIGFDTYSYYGNPSKSVMGIMEKLEETIKNDEKVKVS